MVADAIRLHTAAKLTKHFKPKNETIMGQFNREKVLQGWLDAILDDAEIEADFYGEDITITAHVTQGDVHVYYFSSDRDTYVEVENEDYQDRAYENVCEWLEARLDRESTLAELKERAIQWEEEMDEWERHGFRDAADYYRYRYG